MRSFIGRPIAAQVLALLSLAVAGVPGAELRGQAILVNHFEDAGTRGWVLTVPPSCSDGLQNGSETGLDCGGPGCSSCALPCSPPPFGDAGGPCDSDDDCGVDGICLVGTLGANVFAPEGYCLVDSPFFPGGCAADADCEAGAICVEWLDESGFHGCMPVCGCTGAACPPHQACEDSLLSFRLDDAVCVPGHAEAVDGSACAGVYECSEFSSCLSDAEYPGGECHRTDCIPGDSASCNGGHCVASDPGSAVATICVDSCTSDGDCRTGEGYRCFDPGAGAPDYCRHPHVGDPCGTAEDCGDAPWSCQTGVSFPGGYCTITGCPTGGSGDGCPGGSVCHDLEGPSSYCVDRCVGSSQGTCRVGYSCVDVDPSGAIVLGCVTI